MALLPRGWGPSEKIRHSPTEGRPRQGTGVRRGDPSCPHLGLGPPGSGPWERSLLPVVRPAATADQRRDPNPVPSLPAPPVLAPRLPAVPPHTPRVPDPTALTQIAA